MESESERRVEVGGFISNVLNHCILRGYHGELEDKERGAIRSNLLYAITAGSMEAAELGCVGEVYVPEEAGSTLWLG